MQAQSTKVPGTELGVDQRENLVLPFSFGDQLTFADLDTDELIGISEVREHVMLSEICA